MINSFYFVIIYIAILFLLSAFLIKKALNSFEEYGYCGRSLSIGFVLFTYLGTWIGGGTIIGLVSRSYEFGASQYWIIAMSCIVELFFALLFIGKIRKLGLKSITGFFAMHYPDFGGVVRIPAAAALLIRNVTMIAMQFSALSYLITFVFGINRNLALLLVFLVVIVYTVLSGLWGVAVTDVFPLVITMMMLVMITYLGVFQRVISGGMEDSGSVLYSFIFNMENSWWMILILVGLIAAIMSSADSFLLASGVLISEDIIKRFIIRDADDREMIFFTRIFIVVTGAIAFAFAININDILYLWLTGIGMTSVILVPGYFMGWLDRGVSTRGALAGMAAGWIYVLMIALGIIKAGAVQICIGIGLNLIISILFSALQTKSSMQL